MANQQGLQVMSQELPNSPRVVRALTGVGSALAPSQSAGQAMDISPLAGGNPLLQQRLTPIKRENDLLREELLQQGQQLQATNERAHQALLHQRDGFQRVASEYQHQAREVRDVEVAQARVQCQGQMQGALSQTKRQLHFEENRLRATRSEADQAINAQRQEIIDQAENVLHQRTDAVATEAREALQAKQLQIADIEQRAVQYVYATEIETEGEANAARNKERLTPNTLRRIVDRTVHKLTGNM